MPRSDKDKRNFKRYRKQSGLKIKIGERTYDAETTDYSFDGIGAVVEDSPPITKGSVVDVESSVPPINAKGKVVWAQKTGSGLRLGISKIEFHKKGNLEDYPLSDILIGLQRSGMTGILQINSGPAVKKIYVRNGDIIFSSSDYYDDQIGQYLLRTGGLTTEQFKNYMNAVKKTNRKEGAVLVDLGYIKPMHLPGIVRRLSEEIILSLFSFDNAFFEFKEAPLPPEEVIPLKLSAANIIYKGIKRIANPEGFLDFFNLTLDTVLSFSSDPLDLFQDITLDETDKKILSFIDGRTAIKDIISISPVRDSETLRALYALLSTGIIEVKENGEQSDLSAEEVIEATDMKIDEGFLEKVEEMYGAYEGLGYYGVLGVKDWASQSEIKKAYYRVAKKFHPDKHFRLQSEALKDKLNSIFSYITSAYSTLSDPESRREYDKQLAGRTAKVASNEDMAKLKFEDGRKEYRKGNFKEAFQLLGQAVYLDNNIGEYHYYYGLALARMKRYKEAERAISRALEKSPFNADYVAELGHVLLSLGFMHRARSTFEKALKINPSNQRAIEGFREMEG